MLLCYTPDGKIDQKFGEDGEIRVDFVIDELLPTSTIDSEFGVGGKVVTEVGAKSDTVGVLALQSDGKILVAATCANARHANFALLRYLPNGRLDPSFDDDGKTTLRIGEEIVDFSLLPAMLLGAAAPQCTHTPPKGFQCTVLPSLPPHLTPSTLLSIVLPASKTKSLIE